ncbi:serine/threonine-protein kinase [Hoyosella altamirensis]|uniref:non-specific serine/threonine protein kinase n=1 Tax=Hoyosella altamirensis TaxID=616997 RepID=A0A839RTK2_9ACTN|nr:serine/threonine-protein kinase [Hoyosella altamirensis]MBB3039677.1 non-specific serine/threonine protein kinase [Hoyosella altamirensis]
MTNLEQARRAAGSGYLVAGRYRLRSRIGSAGSAAPWLAKDQLLDRDVAVKPAIVTPGLPRPALTEARARALREGSAAARLSHDNIVTLYDVALDGDDPWMVMEYVPSIGLTHALHLSSRLTPMLVAQIGAQVANALHAAHGTGLLHRDVHPGNVLITNGRNPGRVKLAGFGLAQPADVQFAHLNVIGTPGYLAPEIARGADATPATDVFSLGATLYAAVEGVSPFGPSNDPISQLNQTISGSARGMARRDEFSAVVAAMIDADPANRPSIGEARNALAAIAAGDDGTIAFILSAPLQIPPGETPPWQKRSASQFTHERPARNTQRSTVSAKLPSAAKSQSAPQSAPLWSGGNTGPSQPPAPRFKPRPIVVDSEPEPVTYGEYAEGELADLMSTNRLSLIVALLLLGLGAGAAIIVGIVVSQI